MSTVSQQLFSNNLWDAKEPTCTQCSQRVGVSDLSFTFMGGFSEWEGDIKYGLDYIKNTLCTLHVIDTGFQWRLCILMSDP